MALLRVFSTNGMDLQPIATLVTVDTDRVLRQPWISDADLCLLGWMYRHQDTLSNHHMAFAKDAVSVLTVPVWLAETCDMEVAQSSLHRPSAVTWRGRPYLTYDDTSTVATTPSTKSLVLADHRPKESTPTFNPNDLNTGTLHTGGSSVGGVLAGVVRTLLPAFHPRQHPNPLAVMENVCAPIATQDPLYTADAFLLAMHLAFPTMGGVPRFFEDPDHLSTLGVVLHDRPFSPTRRWRTSLCDWWESRSDRQDLHLGEAIAPIVACASAETARIARAAIERRPDSHTSAHQRMEAARLIDDLRAAIATARPDLAP